MLILASKSPRRAHLLKEAGYQFTQIESPFNDPLEPDSASNGLENAKYLALALAHKKALALVAAPALSHIPNPTILAADTICVDEHGKLIGTPDSPSRARHMLESFENKTHHVVTACSILTPHLRLESSCVDIASVHVGHIGRARIDAYIATGKWQGKAGAYNLSERVSDGWPITVEGDHDTVTGLPVNKLKSLLTQHAILPE
jgi:septum formation protein